MKKVLNSSLTVLVALFVLITSASCDAENKPNLASFGLAREAVETGPPNAIAIVIQATENSADPDLFLRQKDVVDLLSTWATPLSDCVFISVCGDSQVVDTMSIPKSNALDRSQADSDRTFWAKKIIGIASEVTALADEVDTLSALIKAGSWLRDKSTVNKYLLYIGSGIATQNDLFSFTDPGLIASDPAHTVGQLEARNSLPYFDGVTVWFVGLGCTVRPQEPVGTNMSSLRTLYETLITESGGDFRQLYAELGGQSAESDYSVTLVSFPAELPLVFVPSEPIQANSFSKPQIITEEQVRFVGDSAEYVDEAAALSVLSPIADYMIANPDFSLLLIGTTAGDDHSPIGQELSENRAAAVKRTLVSLGVSEDRVYTLGLGSADPWHIYGLGTAGPEAAQNRKVVLISADSPDAAVFMRSLR